MYEWYRICLENKKEGSLTYLRLQKQKKNKKHYIYPLDSFSIKFAKLESDFVVFFSLRFLC